MPVIGLFKFSNLNIEKSGDGVYREGNCIWPSWQTRWFCARDKVSLCWGKWCFDNKFSDVSANGKTIYKLNEVSNLINTEYSNLIDALANLNQEIDPLEMKASAYVLSGHFENEDEFVPIKIIAMQNPITLPKHKFMQIKGKFKESDE